MTHEDRLGVELFQFLLRLAGSGEAFLTGNGEFGFSLHRPERRFRTRDDAHERDGLIIRAALADWLEAGLLELVREILCREDLAAGSGAAPFQPVARQVSDVGLDPIGRNLRSRIGRLSR